MVNSKKSKFRLFGGLLSLLIMSAGSACSAGESRQEESDVSLANESNSHSADLDAAAAALDGMSGETVTLKGFLRNLAPAVILVVDESSNVFDSPIVTIMDRSLWEALLEAGEHGHISEYLASLGCRDQYVELEGEVGYLEAHETHGIVKLHRISVFDGADFEGGSDVCYQSWRPAGSQIV